MLSFRAPLFREHYPTRTAFLDAKARLGAPNAQATPPQGRAAGLPPTPVAVVNAVRRAVGKQVPGLGTIRIVPEAVGNVERLLITVPKFLDESGKPKKFRFARFADHFSRLLSAFGDRVTWIIVAGPQERAPLQHWLERAGIGSRRVTHIDSPFDYSIWAQDPFVALEDGDESILCEGVLFNREQDMTVVDEIDAQSRITGAHSYLYFQGGNVLGGTHETLLGADYVVRNLGRFGMNTVDDVKAEFARLTGTPIRVLGGEDSGHFDWHSDGILTGLGFQPLFHLDMFVTPTGVTDKSGREIVFLSRPRAAHDVLNRWSEVDYLDTPMIDGFFDQIRSQLSEVYSVRELPLLSTRGSLGGKEEFERYYFLTWANCIVESAPGRRRVVLPKYVEHAKTFGVDRGARAALQEVVEAEWKEIGFETKAIDGLEGLAWGDGSIHCISKVLRRGSTAPRRGTSSRAAARRRSGTRTR